MTDGSHYHLTLQEAARLAGCSTKTLYRHMAAGTLSFYVGGDQRRYLSEDEVRARFPARQMSPPNTSPAAIRELQLEVQALSARLRVQEQRLEQVLTLYQPRTIKELADKQAIIRQT